MLMNNKPTHRVTPSLSSRKRQKGASSLEYLMLAAVIIAILVTVSTDNAISDKITATFDSLFSDVQSAANGG